MSSDNQVFRVGLVLIPGFSLMAYASIVEPLRGSNLISGKTLYQWSNLSAEGGSVASGNGLEIATTPLTSQSAKEVDMVIVCGGIGSDRYFNQKLGAALRHLSAQKMTIGSVSTGSFVLAASGLLDNRRCTVHWNHMEAFHEVYPKANVCNEIFVIDDHVFTCAGGTAAMDVMLQFIRLQRGNDFANEVSDLFIYSSKRQPYEGQRMELRTRLGVVQPAILKAIEIMEGALEVPVRLSEIARRVRVSSRQLERLFHRYLASSPNQYYVVVRLERARRLLWQTTMSVMEVGVACGFTSASHFSRAYRSRFGVVPSADRNPDHSTPSPGPTRRNFPSTRPTDALPR